MTRRRRFLLRSLPGGSVLQVLLLAVISLHIPFITAQKSLATCAPGWEWANTKSGDSPCEVAAQLLNLCAYSESFTLAAGGFYTPSNSGSANIQTTTCACNIVAYNVLAACQACQETGSSILSWTSYASACGSCSSENGLSPAPCGPHNAIGFPNSVKPNDGTIEVPSWAYYNSTGETWTQSGARRAADGAETVISAAPKPTSTSSSASPSSSSSSKESDKPAVQSLSPAMKGAVIGCSVLAAIILVIFVTYLLRLCHARRRQKKLKAFSDEAFDKVMAAKQPKSASPKKTQFKRMMTRITLGPKTPGVPKTPGAPVATPKTARFFTFGMTFSPKALPSPDKERMSVGPVPPRPRGTLPRVSFKEPSGKSKERTERWVLRSCWLNEGW